MVDYEVRDGVIRINAKRWAIEPSIEDSEACMGIVINILKEVKAPEKLIISEVRDREYDYPQLKLLIEIADAQRKILEDEKLLSTEKLGPAECETIFPGRLAELTFLVTEVLRKDPIRAYFTISRKIKEISARMEKGTPAYKRCATIYLKNVLEPMERILSKCGIIAYAKPFLSTYRIGDRTIYRELFHPTIRPPFMFTSFKLLPPKEARLIEKYNIGDISVEIWRVPGGIRDFYYIIPPEFRLSPEKYSILEVAYRTLIGRRPPEEITEPERAREIFFDAGVEIVKDLAERMGIKLSKVEIEDLARILVRYTAGFGVLEILLADEKIQDIYINSPIGTTPIYINHSDFEECETNLIPSREDAEAWATRFRLYSGRPLDEANPVLDTELVVPGGRARVAAITKPLSPLGLAFAFRRHRERPWTFPLFIKAKMIDPLFAGLMNFIVQGGRSILIAGGRGSGKCVSGDTLVQLADGKIMKAKEIVEEVFKKAPVFTIDGDEVAFPQDLKLFSLNEEFKVKEASVVAVWKRKSNKIVKLITESGNELKVTPEHPFILVKNGKIQKIPAIDVEVGDFLLSVKKLEINPCFQNNIRIEELPPQIKLIKVNSEIYLKGKTNSKPIKLPKIDEDFYEFLGYLVGDGNISKKGIVFTNGSEELRKRFKDLASKIFEVTAREKFPKKRSPCIKVSNITLVRFLNYLGLPIGRKATKIKLPEFLLTADNEKIACFLRSLFDCDAYIDEKRKQIEYLTGSKELAKQVKFLLLRFGVFSTLSSKVVNGKKYWRIFIYKNYLPNFSVIGFNKKEKKDKLEKAIENLKVNESLEIFPLENILIEIAKELDIKLPRSTNLKKHVYAKKLWNLTKYKAKKFLEIADKRINDLKKAETLLNELEEFLTKVKILKFSMKEFDEARTSGGISLKRLSKITGKDLRTLHKFANGELVKLPIIAEISNSLVLIKNEKLSNLAIKINTLTLELIESFKKMLRNINEISHILQIKRVANVAGLSTNAAKASFSLRLKAIEQIVDAYRKILSSLNIEKNERKINLLKKLISGDITFDRVKYKKLIFNKEDFVYDFTIEPYHTFVANCTILHNTSLLNSLMLEILRKYRIIVIEDSVTGDCEIIIKRNGTIEKSQIGKLVDELIRKYGCKLFNGREVLDFNPENIEVFSVNKSGNVIFSKVKSFIRHKTNKPIYEIRTRTGRKIKVTGDHSLFSLSDDGKLKEVKVSNLKVGDYIAVPRKLPINNEGIKSINLLNYLDKLNGTYVIGEALGKLIRENKKLVKEVSKRLNYPVHKGRTYPTIVGHWQRNATLPASVLLEILKSGCKIDSNELKIKGKGRSKILPIKIELDKDFLNFVGLWLADGSYDKSSVIISVTDENARSVVERVGKKFGISVKMHSDGVSLMLNSRILKQIMSEILELKGNAYTKRIPAWVYNLSKEQIAYLLSGIFSGDGYLSKYEVAINLSSLELIKDIQTLLLFFGIMSRINKMNEKDKTFSLRISGVRMLREFYSQIGFLQENRMQELMKMCNRKTRDVTDIIPLSLSLKEKIAGVLPTFNKHDYIKRGCNIGRQKLMELLADAPNSNDSEIYEVIKNLVYSDIFWDKIESIEVFEGENYVYDISVPNQENFICENIVAHNTLELAVDPMRKLGYNIERMKTRSIITRVEAELPPAEALRTGLRLGESVLIIGEIRGEEALALFEAMRIGALANVVAGTVHAESPYGVYDRIVHDLGVPPTSFKACDLIVISSMLRSPDGLHRFRRVVEVVEVRKHWKEDPETEGGFVPLMQYSAKDDRLKPTDVLVEGESWVLNEIAKKVREWHGAWDLVWENILLRAKIKETMVDFSLKLNRPEILEADWSVEANEMFHLICDEVKREVGGLDSKLIYERWLDWFKRRLR